MEMSSWWTTAAIQRCSQTTSKGYTHHRRHLGDSCTRSTTGGRLLSINKERSHIEETISQNTNMITISAMAFLVLLPLSSSVSTVGEALKPKLDYSLTNEQSTKWTKPYTAVTIAHDGQQREKIIFL